MCIVHCRLRYAVLAVAKVLVWPMQEANHLLGQLRADLIDRMQQQGMQGSLEDGKIYFVLACGATTRE